MNTIYKVVWNDALSLYQVVNELCRSRRKACSVKSVHSASHSLKTGLLTAAVLMTASSAALAEPVTIEGDFIWDLSSNQIDHTGSGGEYQALLHLCNGQ